MLLSDIKQLEIRMCWPNPDNVVRNRLEHAPDPLVPHVWPRRVPWMNFTTHH